MKLNEWVIQKLIRLISQFNFNENIYVILRLLSPSATSLRVNLIVYFKKKVGPFCKYFTFVENQLGKVKPAYTSKKPRHPWLSPAGNPTTNQLLSWPSRSKSTQNSQPDTKHRLSQDLCLVCNLIHDSNLLLCSALSQLTDDLDARWPNLT